LLIAEGIAGNCACAGLWVGYFGKKNLSTAEATQWLYRNGTCRVRMTRTMLNGKT
jgi:hypothetical protein